VEETGEPRQKKQDAHPRCPPLRFEAWVVGWSLGAQGWGWDLAEGHCIYDGGGKEVANQDPGQRGSVRPQ
jgi:hypothetical protein